MFGTVTNLPPQTCCCLHHCYSCLIVEQVAPLHLHPTLDKSDWPLLYLIVHVTSSPHPQWLPWIQQCCYSLSHWWLTHIKINMLFQVISTHFIHGFSKQIHLPDRNVVLCFFITTNLHSSTLSDSPSHVRNVHKRKLYEHSITQKKIATRHPPWTMGKSSSLELVDASAVENKTCDHVSSITVLDGERKSLCRSSPKLTLM